jgi:recombination protein RecA
MFDLADTPLISTGELGLDIMLGGGILRGLPVKIQGRWSAGKTRIALGIAKTFTNVYKEDVLYVDSEGRVSTNRFEFCRKIGIDLDHFHYTKPASLEEAFDIVNGAFEIGSHSAIVLDSLAAMAPKEDLGLSYEENPSRANHARKSNRFFRDIVGRANKLWREGKKVPTLIVLNQVRKNTGPDATYNPEFTPGGGMQDNAAATVISLTRGKNIVVELGKAADNSVSKDVKGFFTWAESTKHNSGSPHKRSTFGLVTDQGGFCGHPQFSYLHGETFLRFGMELGMIQVGGGGNYTILDKSVRGKPKAVQFLYDNEEIQELIVNAIRDALPFDLSFDPRQIKQGIAKEFLVASGAEDDGDNEEVTEEHEEDKEDGVPEPEAPQKRKRGRPKVADGKPAGKKQTPVKKPRGQPRKSG